MNLHIESRNVSMLPAWRADIEARFAELQNGRDDIIHGRATVTKHRHHRKADDNAEVLVLVQIPGHTVTARKREATFELAIRESFDAVAAELETIREKRATHEVRLPPVPRRGVIARLFRDDGYGFILEDGGGEVYFHRNAVHDLTFDELTEGTEISFNAEQGEKGLQATTVNPLPQFPERYAV